MPRPRLESREKLLPNAMMLFWKNGYHATSIDDLVKATSVARGGIYADFGGKGQMFQACLDLYRQEIAAPAIAILNSKHAGLDAIEGYFYHFIDMHRRHGLPGPGCFIANSMTEIAPHEDAIRTAVNAHSKDLHAAFLAALSHAGSRSNANLSQAPLNELALFLVTSSQGLWSYARSVTDISLLESYVRSLMDLLRSRFS